jgi:crossover junction endodeoxyribonuclease RuvC
MSSSKERIILGIDPGTTILGYGIIEVREKKMHLVTLGVLHLEKIEDHHLKLQKIFERTVQLIDGFHPDELAIEGSASDAAIDDRALNVLAPRVTCER